MPSGFSCLKFCYGVGAQVFYGAEPLTGRSTGQAWGYEGGGVGTTHRRYGAVSDQIILGIGRGVFRYGCWPCFVRLLTCFCVSGFLSGFSGCFGVGDELLALFGCGYLFAVCGCFLGGGELFPRFVW